MEKGRKTSIERVDWSPMASVWVGKALITILMVVLVDDDDYDDDAGGSVGDDDAGGNDDDFCKLSK